MESAHAVTKWYGQNIRRQNLRMIQAWIYLYIHMYLFILYKRTKLFMLEQKHQKDPLFSTSCCRNGFNSEREI